MKNRIFHKIIFTEKYSTDGNTLNMMYVGASSEIQHKRHNFGTSKTTDAYGNWVL